LPRLRAFGQRLKELRGEHTGKQISLWLAKDYGEQLNESSYWQYEAGTVWAPDIGVVVALAKMHGVSFLELVALIVANRRDTTATDWSDLLRHTDDPLSVPDSTIGGTVDASVPAARRLAELETEVSSLRDQLAQAEDLARKLLKITYRGEEGSPVTRAKTKRRTSRGETR
jgi:hypothetical protein